MRGIVFVLRREKQKIWLNRIQMAPPVIAVSAISAICWIVFDGALPLVVSILAGMTIALKATLGDEED